MPSVTDSKAKPRTRSRVRAKTLPGAPGKSAAKGVQSGPKTRTAPNRSPLGRGLAKTAKTSATKTLVKGASARASGGKTANGKSSASQQRASGRLQGKLAVRAKGKRPASIAVPLNGARIGSGGGRRASSGKIAHISAKPKRLDGKTAKIQPLKNGKKALAKKTGFAKTTGLAKKTRPASKAVSGREANGAMQHNGSNGKDTHGMNGTAVATRPKSSAGAAAARNGDNSADAKRSEIVLPPSYKPSESEPFMNARHRHYFRLKLQKWKEDIVRQNMETLKGLHDDSPQQADPADRATVETDRALELRARDRQRKLMGKIDSALARIEEGSYGYCEETGEPISLKRLDARPIATLSLEAQERRERRERIFRDD